MANDLGYGDPSCYGTTDFKTQHLDKLPDVPARGRKGHSPASFQPIALTFAACSGLSR
jgi:hypothetical protein